jgi:hypothetical protein
MRAPSPRKNVSDNAKDPTAIVINVRESWNLLLHIPWPVNDNRQTRRAAILSPVAFGDAINRRPALGE